MDNTDSATRAACAQAQALYKAGAHAEALAVLSPFLKFASPALEVLALAAVLQERLGLYQEALRANQALAARLPWQAGLCNAIGRVQALLDRPAEALPWFEAVLAREPQNPDALFNRANVLRLLGRREDAIAAYRAVLPLHAGYARLALVEIARQQQALLDFDGARVSYLQLDIVTSGALEAIGYRLNLEAHRWPPDPAASTALARELGTRWAAQQPAPALPPPAAREAGRPLRIGLVSADLRAHPVGFFLDSLLSSSAARALDWVAYSNLTPRLLPDSPVARRLRAATSQWHDVADWPDAQLAQQIRADGIDVLVDLSGYTAQHRLAAFAARPAPLQLSWLGYYATTGLPFIDGVIADGHCVPPGEEAFFTEPVLRLPHTRFCYTPPPDAPDIAASPVLQHGAISFGCFQQISKIAPQVLQAWARIAAAVPDARWIVVLGDAPTDLGGDEQRFRARCAAAGFAPQQMEIRGRLEFADYLNAHAEVDLMLDTFPYTGGTTTADALWMGVPTLALSTPGMLGRQGEQIMTAAGLSDWVTHSVDQYVAEAIARGRNAAHADWAAQRPTLRERLRSTPMFDAERFGRDWMAAVRGLWQQRLGPEGPPQSAAAPRFVFYVPSYQHPFGGVKVIYEIVATLNRLGFCAYTHTPPGSKAGDFWSVSKYELTHWQPTPGDIVIAPEVMGEAWLRSVRAFGVPLWLFVQNWSYVDKSFVRDPITGGPLFDGTLVVSDTTEAIVRRCFPELPCLRTPPAIAAMPEPRTAARPAIAYMPRKLPALARWLRAVWPLAFPDLADVEWIEIDGLPHAEVLQRLQQAHYFVSLQATEALALPALEAMAAGCLVIGFTGIGGREYARPENGVWIDEGDGLALLDALGEAVRAERREAQVYEPMRQQARATVLRYSAAAQEAALDHAFGQIVQRWHSMKTASTSFDPNDTGMLR